MSGPSSSTSNNNQGTSQSSRLLTHTTPSPSSSTTTPVTSSAKLPPLPIPSALDEKIFSRYSNTLLAESNKRKTEVADHMKRLAELRKEAEHLEHTDWMYEPIEKLLGK